MVLEFGEEGFQGVLIGREELFLADVEQALEGNASISFWIQLCISYAPKYFSSVVG